MPGAIRGIGCPFLEDKSGVEVGKGCGGDGEGGAAFMIEQELPGNKVLEAHLVTNESHAGVVQKLVTR